MSLGGPEGAGPGGAVAKHAEVLHFLAQLPRASSVYPRITADAGLSQSLPGSGAMDGLGKEGCRAGVSGSRVHQGGDS